MLVHLEFGCNPIYYSLLLIFRRSFGLWAFAIHTQTSTHIHNRILFRMLMNRKRAEVTLRIQIFKNFNNKTISERKKNSNDMNYDTNKNKSTYIFFDLILISMNETITTTNDRELERVIENNKKITFISRFLSFPAHENYTKFYKLIHGKRNHQKWVKINFIRTCHSFS